MKKILFVLITSVLFISCCLNVYAATPNEDLYNYASKTYNIGGSEVKLSDGNLQSIKRYLNENEVSRENADEIIKKVDEIVSVLKKYKTTNPVNLPTDKKKEILDLAKEAAILAGASVTWDGNEEALTIYDANGKKVDVIKLKSYVDENGNKILAPTGNNYYVYFYLFGLLIICGFIYFYGKKKICAKN